MSPVEAIERHIAIPAAVAGDRLRAAMLRLRGAKIAGKPRIGARCRVQRPWRLTLGTRVQIEHDVYLKIEAEKAMLKIGDHSFIGCRSEFDVTESVEIGSKVLIGPGCFVTDHDHNHAAGPAITDQGCTSAPVRIEDGVWLGAHVVVLAGVTVGAGAIAAAGAVVTKDVAPNGIVGGVPARVIGQRS